MISGKEIHVLDQNSEFVGVPPGMLMENAGRGIAHYILKHLKPENKSILLLCGTGNNGGDGFVAARYLAEHVKVSVFVTGKTIKTQVAHQNFCKLTQSEIPIYYNRKALSKLLNDHDIIVDALLGIGLSGELREPYAKIVQMVNTVKNTPIVSVDTPTGLGTRLAVIPKVTITFHDVKEGMTPANSGAIHIVDIGIPKEAEQFVGPGELSVYYPRPEKTSHKGDNGVVLIIGGGPYVGAPALAGLASLRTGVDLVYIVTPRRSWQSIASFSPNFIVTDLSDDIITSEDVPQILPLLDKCTSVVLGPGIGDSRETQQAVVQLLKRIVRKKKPLVVDADAIQVIGQQRSLVKNGAVVITPHAGEFYELTGVPLPRGIAQRVKVVQHWAQKLGVTLLVKGPIDILAHGSDSKQNKVHNEAMTVGGTGDVLAGIIGALLSKHVDSFNAVCMAAFLNGQAGNYAFHKKSYGVTATDIIDEIPTVLKQYL
jgi:NAD(P)H-hydrate epimerase